MPDSVPIVVNEEALPQEDRMPEAGTALCLSGGGYRAMLFHLGTLWALNHHGWLRRLDRISSVSGGSITAGVLGLRWKELVFTDGQASNFSLVVGDVRRLAGKTLDASSILGGLFGRGSIADRVIAAYDRELFHGATLQDLPDAPRFVINATSVQSAALFRFEKPYAWDYRVGKIDRPTIRLAEAVAASSAFPPVLSPVRLDLRRYQFVPGTGEDLQRPPFTTTAVLTDGGVYDNMGIETAWKRYRRVLVSDAGGKTQPEDDPKGDWARHSLRVNSLIDNQVRSLRKRQVIGSFRPGDHEGAYWGIRGNITHYGLSDALVAPIQKTMALAEVATRLEGLPDATQKMLINWGFAITDAAMRKHVDHQLAAPTTFPYPEVGVG